MNKFTPLTSAALAAALALAVSGANAAGDPMSGSSNQLTQDQQQAFQKLDTNNDGKISQDEAKADPKLAKQFSRVDSNSDSAIDQGEFAQFEAQSPGSQSSGKSQNQ